MTEESRELANYVTAMAQAIALPIPTEYQPNVVANFERIAAIAQLVTEFPLPNDLESAPTFEP